jgi:ubiquinone/menaquinone biosynthesis C-methylase UbiE
MDVTFDNGNAQTALWNGPAGRAWVDTQELLDEMYKPLEELLVEVVTDGPPGPILDVGCGTGSTTLAVARLRGATHGVVGIDISHAMIAAARARAAREDSAANFLCANAQEHVFTPPRFPTIISRFGVMFFDDPVRAFANLRSAADEGARLQFIAWRSAAENPFMTTAERAAAPLLPTLPDRRPDAPGQFAFARRDRVRDIIEESGWTEIDVQPIDVACAFPASALDRYLTRLGPVGLVLQEADEQTRTRVIEVVRPAFAPYVHGSQVRFSAACWMVSARRAGS